MRLALIGIIGSTIGVAVLPYLGLSVYVTMPILAALVLLFGVSFLAALIMSRDL